MLATATLLSPPVRTGGAAAPAEPGVTPGATPPFARALDQATAQQRGVADEAEADKTTDADAPGGAVHAALAPRRAAAARTAVTPPSTTPAPEADVPVPVDIEAASSQPTRAAEGPAAAVAEGLSFDLSSWVPGLPLTPLAPVPAVPAAPIDADAPVAAGSTADAGLAVQRDTKLSNELPGSEHFAAHARHMDETKSLSASAAPAETRRNAAAQADYAHAATALRAEQGKEPRGLSEVAPTTPAALPLSLKAERGREFNPVLPGQAAAIAPAPALSSTVAATPAAPFQAELQAALGTPAFVPALGAQLSVLVRDGIEHARLKLNPAEMGPIDVRISVDGQQAQVDFSAAHAVTRQLLQDAVPALASALRESGLTLTGGGVFDQSREQRGDLQRGPAMPRSAAFDGSHDATPSGLPLPRPAVVRGVVDLYA
jgi:flagellar hook-length control protein FliK